MRVPWGHISFSPPVLPVFPATGIFHHLQIEIRAVHFCFEACLPKKARRKHLGRFFDDWAGLCHLMKRRQDIKWSTLFGPLEWPAKCQVHCFSYPCRRWLVLGWMDGIDGRWPGELQMKVFSKSRGWRGAGEVLQQMGCKLIYAGGTNRTFYRAQR